MFNELNDNDDVDYEQQGEENLESEASDESECEMTEESENEPKVKLHGEFEPANGSEDEGTQANVNKNIRRMTFQY